LKDWQMGSIYYAVSIVAVWMIVDWCMTNDGRARTSGILELKHDRERPSAGNQP
jgi:hypothetical protein